MGLLSSGVLLLVKFFLSGFFGLLLMDVLNQIVLVLELITLGCKIELVVHVLVNLLVISIFLQQSSEDSLSSHPDHLCWHSGVLGSLSFTETVMSSLSPGFVISLHS